MTDDLLSKKLTVQAKLTEAGIEAKVKSRFVAAIDRLLGALLAIPAVKLEAIASRMGDRGRLETEVYDALIKRVSEGTNLDEDALRPMLIESLASGMQGVANKKSIVERAIGYLGANDGGGAEPANDDRTIDPDWLSHFGSHTEKVSLEAAQDLWARVLAGEARSPGTFSLATLHFLAVLLDQQTAKWFEDEVKERFEGSWVLKPPNDQMQGERLTRANWLEEAGLIGRMSGVSSIQRTLETNADGITACIEGQLALVIHAKQGVALKVVPLTRIGREICQLLPPVNPESVLERVAQTLHDNKHVTAMEIHTIESGPDGTVRIELSDRPLRVLKTPDP